MEMDLLAAAQLPVYRHIAGSFPKPHFCPSLLTALLADLAVT